jgi:hypothetical protein
VSAVILAVIVIMWAVVLVPMWLRRHDTATESRSVDRFSTAMRVLSRRGPGGPDRRYVLMPKRESNASVHVSGASAHRRPPTRPTPAAPPARPKTRPSLAVRRRRTLLAVAGVTFLSFVLTVTGVIGWPLQLVVDLILVAFVVHLRTQAKRAAAVTRQRRRAAVAPPAPQPAYAPSAAAARPAPAARVAPEEPVTAPMQPVEPVAAEIAATGTDDGWQPVPVPPPTYTMKPKAPQRWTYVRPDAPAAKQSAAVEVEEQPMVTEPGEPAEVGELDGILEHRWAVND